MRAPVNADIAKQHYAAEAAKIVRSCVHCGFCNATCPTYQLSGDELEGPRGRIYLIKTLLEEGHAGATTQQHLDQCLLCRNCETTCPSGVKYVELSELVLPEAKRDNPTSWHDRLVRRLLVAVVPYPRRFRPLVALGRLAKPLLPRTLADKLPPRAPLSHGVLNRTAAGARHQRRVLLLGGCAQAVLRPSIDVAATAVFDRVGITLIALPQSGCCGALSLHLGHREAAVAQAKQNLDAWWPDIENGAEAVMATSSGCGVQLKDYAALLADEPDYAERATRLQAMVCDPIELLDIEALKTALDDRPRADIAFQAPCTLQHGQRLRGRVEAALTALGWQLQPVNEAHLCCGSAGAYSVLHPQQATQLRTRKLSHLLASSPTQIVTSNIGCQLHLSADAPVPVNHWLELLAAALNTRAE